jgi:hypothetical protein
MDAAAAVPYIRVQPLPVVGPQFTLLFCRLLYSGTDKVPNQTSQLGALQPFVIRDFAPHLQTNSNVQAVSSWD